ncbi:MAG: OmpH family outer membrane protein [Flavobacteriaceae bacterium]
MKKIILVLIASVLLMSCTQQQKIGFINSEELLKKYKETVALEAEMKILDQKTQAELPALYKAFQDKLAGYQKKAARMTTAQKQEAENILKREEQIIKQRQNIVQTTGREAMMKITETANNFVKDYGKKNGYEMILGTVNLNGAVMYGDDKTDLTDIILTALNADFDKKSSTTETPVKKEVTPTTVETKK